MKKKNPKPFRARFENTIGNQIFNFFCWSKRSLKFFYNRNRDLLISKLLSKSILDFGKWSNCKYAQIHICVFSVWPLPKVQNLFWIQFWEGTYLNSKKKLERCDQQKRAENWISHCICKSCAEGVLFHDRALFFSPDALYSLSSRGGAKLLILTSPIYQNGLLGEGYFSFKRYIYLFCFSATKPISVPRSI